MNLYRYGYQYTNEDGVLDKYIDLFAGRGDAYAEGTPAGAYRCVRLPLTARVVRGAFYRQVALAFYPLAPDGLTHVFVVDFDSIDHGYDDARRLSMAFQAHEIDAYITRSRRGGHCWITLDRRIPASSGRLALRAGLAEIGLVDGGEIELRPAVDRLADLSQVGYPIRPPLMRNPKSGDQFPLLRPDESVLGFTVEEIVTDITRASADRFEDFAGGYQPPDPAPPPDAAGNGGRARSSTNGRGSVSGVLQDKFGRSAKPRTSVQCPFHPDEHPSLSITPDDRRAICHAPGCWAHAEGRGRDAYDLLFAHAIIRSIQGPGVDRS